MSVYRLNCLAIGLLLMCLPVSAQEPDLGITIGGQTWDIDGNYQLFRTRENREDGPLVEELWLNLVDKDNNYALFDHFRLDASGFGGNPHGRLAFSMTRNETYKLELNYRRFSHYSSLIDFANPLFDDGVTNSQHTLDQTSHNLNLNLTLRPGKKLQPILGWNWYDKGGPRRTTFSIGGDEFRLDSQVDESGTELFAGLAFKHKKVSGQLTQGMREFKGRGLFNLAAAEGEGNNPGSLFGREVTLDDLNRLEKNKSETPITRFHASARLNKRVHLMAAFVHTDQDQDFQVDDSLAGQLVSFRLRRVYGARQETITSSGSAPSWHGDVKVVAEPIANLNLSARYSRQHRKMDGSALISALFTQVVSFANRPADDIAELNQATTFWERDDDRYELQFNRRFAKSWGIKGGWNRLERDSRIEADISQIVIPGQQDGHHQRNIDRYNLGAYYRKSNLKLDLELRQERGDRSILRTDFLDRQSYRVKAHLDLAENLVLRASLRGADYDNLSAEAGFDGSEVQYNVSLDVIGKKGVDLQVNYSAYNLKQENILTYPQDLSQVPLLHRENGDSFEGHMDWRLKRWNININLARYENKGALPYNMEWGRLRTEYLLSESFRTIFELNKRQYRENLALADYSGVGYAFFLRWRN